MFCGHVLLYAWFSTFNVQACIQKDPYLMLSARNRAYYRVQAVIKSKTKSA